MRSPLSSFLVICLFGITHLCTAQQFVYGSGSGMSRGETGVATTDAFAAKNNPALIGLSDSTFSIGASAQQKYLIEGLHSIEVATSIGIGKGSIGLAGSSYGDDNLSERILGLAYGLKLSETVAIGARLDYFDIDATFAGSESILYPEIGVAAKLSDAFTLGAKLRNPFQTDLDEPFSNQLTSWSSIGFDYKPTEQFQTSIQADLTNSDQLSAALGISYTVRNRIELSVGGRSRPSLLNGGIGINLGSVKAQVGSSFHQQLGTTPHAVFQYIQ